MRAIRVTSKVVVPEAALRMRAVRSSGPGGQNVNKVASKVELRVELARIEGLADDARSRLRELAAPRLDADALLLVVSQKTRDQSQNLEDAREKVRGLVLRALIPPRPRRPTRPSAAAKRARLREKRHAAERKASRRAPPED